MGHDIDEIRSSLYKPSTRDFELVLKEILAQDADRLKAIWTYSGTGVELRRNVCQRVEYSGWVETTPGTGKRTRPTKRAMLLMTTSGTIQISPSPEKRAHGPRDRTGGSIREKKACTCPDSMSTRR